ncbi:MAG: hypothetical protein ISS19_04140 [Bacteroidales bacterium]|nr:hypothetical protein [Bacteroidales bacterium]
MLVEKEGISDTLLYIRSERKAVKEMSMNQHFTSHFEQGLAQVQQGIQKKAESKLSKRRCSGIPDIVLVPLQEDVAVI